MKVSIVLLLVFGFVAFIGAAPTEDNPEKAEPQEAKLEDEELQDLPVDTPKEDESMEEDESDEDDTPQEEESTEEDENDKDVDAPTGSNVSIQNDDDEQDPARKKPGRRPFRCYLKGYRPKVHCIKKPRKQCWRCCTRCRTALKVCKHARRHCHWRRVCFRFRVGGRVIRACPYYRRRCIRIQSKCHFGGVCTLRKCHRVR